jgi:hypothetical protein
MNKNELLELARKKAKGLTEPNTQIRLTSDPASYWVVNFAGILHIGYFVEGYHRDEPQPDGPFFPGKQEYEMSNAQGKAIMMLQRL